MRAVTLRGLEVELDVGRLGARDRRRDLGRRAADFRLAGSGLMSGVDVAAMLPMPAMLLRRLSAGRRGGGRVDDRQRAFHARVLVAREWSRRSRTRRLVERELAAWPVWPALASSVKPAPGRSRRAPPRQCC